MLKKLLVLSLAIVTLLAAGCGGGKDAKKEAAIKVGATAGPHAEVVEKVCTIRWERAEKTSRSRSAPTTARTLNRQERVLRS